MQIAIIVILSLLLVIGLISLVILLKPAFNYFLKNIVFKSSYDKIGQSSQIRLINQLRESVEYLSKYKIGAIITIENNDVLDNYRTDGIILDANISSGLLISIFNKNSPLHDGAVIIRKNKIYYASTFYKITDKSVPASYGSRHRAAIGISEQTDAVTILVSEQTGLIRLLRKNIILSVRLDQFQEELIKILKG
ncbi:diadenylate cyclase [Mycoplasmopsis bovirhinis]|uniref:Membrane protein n=1 Tax=Mycoplasmopsis bovirhinis TaxID=29553 RepID=A0A449AF68_9BACT|nr:DNA integrity scanning protein DisA nucleotide-binding domain protein [Mycoplasmopsis bovirhinis]VEU63623.1 membrane protein [Mycoplasmopsis bovirhinis]